MRAREGGAWRTPIRGRTRFEGAWRNLTRAVVYTDGQWRNGATFVQPLALSISGSPFGQVAGSGVVVTSPATAVPTGGFGPLTYSWARIGGAPADIVFPTAASTTFSLPLTGPAIQSATFQCTVTDAFGASAASTVTATFSAITFD